MARDMKAEGYFEVKWFDEAADEFRKAFPNLPPGPEIVLWIIPEPCSICGTEPTDQQLHGFDPETISVEGVITGPHFCRACMEAGH